MEELVQSLSKMEVCANFEKEEICSLFEGGPRRSPIENGATEHMESFLQSHRQ